MDRIKKSTFNGESHSRKGSIHSPTTPINLQADSGLESFVIRDAVYKGIESIPLDSANPSYQGSLEYLQAIAGISPRVAGSSPKNLSIYGPSPKKGGKRPDEESKEEMTFESVAKKHVQEMDMRKKTLLKMHNTYRSERLPPSGSRSPKSPQELVPKMNPFGSQRALNAPMLQPDCIASEVEERPENKGNENLDVEEGQHSINIQPFREYNNQNLKMLDSKSPSSRRSSFQADKVVEKS
eukprot:TRINITY_DN22052_c0_g1_i1.p1 TRINITY_DN22052_c0_g1~~TRINITY_DN22052_c0_g1_i1.p1  ORF type:complete len:239 (+),score=35.43 TRINITY_DN22052_c0_g1_i1:337-1053(+)